MDLLDGFQVSHLRLLQQLAENYEREKESRLEAGDFLGRFCEEELGGDQRLLYLHTEEVEVFRSLYCYDKSNNEMGLGRRVSYLMLTDLGADFLDFVGIRKKKG